MLAIVAGTLVDGTGGPPVADQVVLIDGERIIDVLPAADARLETASEIVQAPELTLLPGLIDAHAHVAGLLANAMFSVPDPDEFTDRFMRRMAEHGITTVRDTGSPDIDQTFNALKAGRPGWPRFFGSGPNLDGSPGGPWLGLRNLKSPAEVTLNVDELLDGGSDFIKVYAWLNLDLLEATVAVVHDRGARLAAHVGHVLTAEQVVRAGVDALEHVRIGPELVPDDQRAAFDSLPYRRHDEIASFAAWRFVDPAGPAATAMIELLVDRGVFITPTLCYSESVLRPQRHDRLLGDWDPPGEVMTMWRDGRYDVDYDEHDRQWAPIELSRQMEFLGRAHEAGLRIAAGTDTPNPFISPGNSLHHELELLVECGLTPLEAIHAATSIAAELVGRSDLGTIAPGQAADLVLVGGDPTRDIRATADVRGVLMKGRFAVRPDGH